MGKKCVPGLICIENMTLFLLILIVLLFIYIWHNQYRVHQGTRDNSSEKVVLVNTSSNIPQMVPISSRQDVFNDPYSPPGKNPVVYPRNSGHSSMMNNSHYASLSGGDVRGIPVNVQTRGVDNDYQQMGILTRSNYSGNEMILPLMGRKHMSGRDKWQYYTISGTGNLNTKLPISVNGRSCTSEYGCDDIYNGDTVYVEGYKDTFNATIYENNQFHYIPA